jgi:hypothetical protein
LRPRAPPSNCVTSQGEEKQAALFKKSAQKYLLLVLCARLLPKPPVNRNFLLLFFKKEALSALMFRRLTPWWLRPHIWPGTYANQSDALVRPACHDHVTRVRSKE